MASWLGPLLLLLLLPPPPPPVLLLLLLFEVVVVREEEEVVMVVFPVGEDDDGLVPFSLLGEPPSAGWRWENMESHLVRLGSCLCRGISIVETIDNQ